MWFFQLKFTASDLIVQDFLMHQTFYTMNYFFLELFYRRHFGKRDGMRLRIMSCTIDSQF